MDTGHSLEHPSFFAHEELRGGQSAMLKDCRQVLLTSGHHLAAAPTGIGKTAAALSAALETARSHPLGRTIFFLTGRQSQHRIVIETIMEINERLASTTPPVRCVDIIGRTSMCLDVDPFSGRCACEYELPEDLKESGRQDLRNDILSKTMHVEEVISRARALRICPWSTARSAVRDADIVICDYNHFFIDDVRDRSLPAMNVELEQSILIVDEAHSLPSRIRKGLERRLSAKMLQNASYELEEFTDSKGDDAGANWIWVQSTIHKLRENLSTQFAQWDAELTELEAVEKRIEIADFFDIIKGGLVRNEWDSNPKDAMSRLSILLKQVIVDMEDSPDDEKELACWKIAELFDTILRFQNSKGMVLVFSIEGVTRLSCHLLDPGLVSQSVFQKSAGSILMSGTLYPPRMYADLLGISALSPWSMAEYESPFQQDRRPTGIATDVTTLFTKRGLENTEKIVNHIRAISSEAPGHIAVFVPSYKMLGDIIEERGWPGRTIIIEETNWSKAQIDSILSDLELYRKQGIRVMLSGVYRGKLSEGIDYRNNLLDAIICVGIPVAPPNVTSAALREYLDGKFGKGKGWLYGSTQPAINSVIQAMGRAIRSYEDRAFVMLLDYRHNDRGYRNCHPDGFTPLSCTNSDVTQRYAARFFRNFTSES